MRAGIKNVLGGSHGDPRASGQAQMVDSLQQEVLWNDDRHFVPTRTVLTRLRVDARNGRSALAGRCRVCRDVTDDLVLARSANVRCDEAIAVASGDAPRSAR